MSFIVQLRNLPNTQTLSRIVNKGVSEPKCRILTYFNTLKSLSTSILKLINEYICILTQDMKEPGSISKQLKMIY